MKKTILELSTKLEEERSKTRAIVQNAEKHLEVDSLTQGDMGTIKLAHISKQGDESQERKKKDASYKRPCQNLSTTYHQGTAGPSNNHNRDTSTTQSQDMDCDVQQKMSYEQGSSQSGDEVFQEQPTISSKTNRVKPPIINIVETSRQETYRLLKETLGLSNFKIKRLNSNKHYVQLDILRG